MRKFTALFIFIAATTAAMAQDPAKSVAPQSEAKKAFAILKALSGSWKGTMMGIPINFTIRPASSGTTVLHEAHTEAGRPPNHEVTMFFVEEDRILATHYCDSGNRSRMEGKLALDGKSIEFTLLELSGSPKGGFLKGMALSMPDADRQVVDLTFVQPDGKPIPIRGEFQRTK